MRFSFMIKGSGGKCFLVVLWLLSIVTVKSFVTHSFRSAVVNCGGSSTRRWSGQKTKEVADMNADDSIQQPIRRKPQKRRQTRNRRPRNYWTQPDNVAREIRLFWAKDCGLGEYYKSSNATLNYDENMIPNEGLLNYYGRHDMRAAFASLGGREAVAEQLGGAKILPGRWKEAVDEPQIQALLQIDPALSSEYSPLSALDVSSTTTTTEEDNTTPTRWSHQSDRRPKGFWNKTRVIQELYLYVDGVRKEHGRPSVWMPRPNEMAASGRDDLRQAIRRFGGTKHICTLAGMVPFREWYFFEGQLELLISLKLYIDEYQDSDYSIFPVVSDIRRNGYEQLHSLIQYYGGRKYLAYRLGMSSGSLLPNDDFVGVSFGPFDLTFAIELMTFVRNDHCQRVPPLKTPLLVMPSRTKLLEAGRPDLDEAIQRYGGYENVARRLGLACFS